jgi:hypothetical protein
LQSPAIVLLLKEMMMKMKFLFSAAVLAGSALPAQASDYGCRVLLCLANPAGPMAVSECVPPIRQLYRDLARGRAFPSCTMASAPGASAGQSWAQHGISHYDACPTGTTALGAGIHAVTQSDRDTIYTGIGSGDQLDAQDGLGQKICVGRQVGRTRVSVDRGDSTATVSARVYDSIVVQNPVTQPNYIDVYVDSAFSHRVRW